MSSLTLGPLCLVPPAPPRSPQTTPVNFVSLIGQALGRMHTLDVSGERVPMLWDVRSGVLQLVSAAGAP